MPVSLTHGPPVLPRTAEAPGSFLKDGQPWLLGHVLCFTEDGGSAGRGRLPTRTASVTAPEPRAPGLL